MEMLFNSLPFNSIAQNTRQTSLSRRYHIEFLVKMYRAKVPSKHCQKFAVRCPKRLYSNARHELLVQNSCPKQHHKFAFDKREYVSAFGKNPVQKCCPKHSQKTRLEERQFLHARQENIEHESLPKHR